MSYFLFFRTFPHVPGDGAKRRNKCTTSCRPTTAASDVLVDSPRPKSPDNDKKII
jgi:hypothetical protein